MNKTCARCEKTVYPIEELKCLDKIWHKGCFKCQECGMTLNMKTYKGYGKLPYCEAHVPKAKHTTMAETPELRRIAENTRLQSNVNYHADFEKSKGKFTQVADDPETLRIKANTQIFSNVAYHGDLAKKAAMEKQRTLNENGELVELPTPDNYDIQIESYENLLPPAIPPPSIPPPAPYNPPKQHTPQYPTNSDYTNSNSHRVPSQPKYETDYPANYQNYSYQPPVQNYPPNPNVQNYPPNPPPVQNYPPNPKVQISAYPTQPKATYDDYTRSREMIQREQQTNQQHTQAYQQQAYQHQQAYQQQQRIGKIEDYDPVTDGPRQQAYMPRPTATLVYNSEENNGRGSHHQSQQSSRRPIGNVSDMDPLAGESYRAPTANTQQVRQQSKQSSAIGGRVYVAMYDYDANDNDEVSFVEGDLISNVSSIDEGWMTGQVLRTGRTGMLPANYVELAPQ